MPVLDFATRSIARRLFFTAAALSFLLLLVASLLLTQYYRRNAEDVFERRLEVYLRAIVAHVSQPGEEGRGPGQLGEPQFELPQFRLVLADHADRRRRARDRGVALAVRVATAQTGGFRRHSRDRRRAARDGAGAGRPAAAHRRARDRRGRHRRLSGAGRRQRRRGRARHRPLSLRPHHRLRAARHRARHRRRVPGEIWSAPVAHVGERAWRDQARRARTHLRSAIPSKSRRWSTS